MKILLRRNLGTDNETDIGSDGINIKGLDLDQCGDEDIIEKKFGRALCQRTLETS